MSSQTRFTALELNAFEKAICAPEGDELLALMRTLHFGARADQCHKNSLQSAKAFEWVKATSGGNLVLSVKGQRIADAAREFCNWIDDGMGLPMGLTPADVAGKQILDVGCGWGRYLLAITQHGGHAYGVDLDEGYVQLAPIFARKVHSRPGHIVCGAAEMLPFESASFDIVISIRSMAWMDNRKAIQEFRRVLKPSGRVIIVTGTMSSILRNLLVPPLSLDAIRKSIRSAKILANSLCYTICGRRIIGLKSSLSTASPVVLSERRLVSFFHKYGLSLVDRDRESLLFVLQPKVSA